MKFGSIACLLPFYNEQASIISVLDVLTSVSRIKRIICIDDGSNDSGSDLINGRRYDNVSVLKLPGNVGKTKAVRSGLGQVTEDFVLMFDADLREVTKEEVEKIIMHFFRNDKLDMLIVKVDGGNTIIDRLLLRDVVLSGIRILRTYDLREILKEKIVGYQLEVRINQYMILNKKRVGWIQGKLLNVFKSAKWGAVNGVLRSWKMEVSIFFFLGLRGYIRQIMAAFKWKMRDETR